MKLFCAFSYPVNCVVGGFGEVRIQMLTLGHYSGGNKLMPPRHAGTLPIYSRLEVALLAVNIR